MKRYERGVIVRYASQSREDQGIATPATNLWRARNDNSATRPSLRGALATKQSPGYLSRLLLLLCISAVAGLAVTAGCGSSVTVREEEYAVEAPPSDLDSAGVLNGFGYATAGEHYKAVQSLGRPVAEDIQTSTNGIYQVK